MSPKMIFFLLTLMVSAASLQHTTIQLFIAKMPGNKFVNGILFGVAEALAMVFSNLLLLYLDDMVALRIVFVSGILSYIVLIVCHEEFNPFMVHSAIIILIGSIGSWLNINLLILELRVPSKNVASV
jgi:hypothetical protein